MIQFFLAKFKLFVKSSFKSNFFIFEAKLILAKLKQTFIKTSIFYFFDLEYQIYIKINAFN